MGETTWSEARRQRRVGQRISTGELAGDWAGQIVSIQSRTNRLWEACRQAWEFSLYLQGDVKPPKGLEWGCLQQIHLAYVVTLQTSNRGKLPMTRIIGMCYVPCHTGVSFLLREETRWKNTICCICTSSPSPDTQQACKYNSVLSPSLFPPSLPLSHTARAHIKILPNQNLTVLQS